MKTDVDLAGLPHEELVALVRHLRQQLAEREREITRLIALLTEKQTPPPMSEPSQKPSEDVAEVTSGSQEDLLTQLEKIYPGGQ
jgi:hypothetical protein